MKKLKDKSEDNKIREKNQVIKDLKRNLSETKLELLAKKSAMHNLTRVSCIVWKCAASTQNPSRVEQNIRRVLTLRIQVGQVVGFYIQSVARKLRFGWEGNAQTISFWNFKFTTVKSKSGPPELDEYLWIFEKDLNISKYIHLYQIYVRPVQDRCIQTYISVYI